MSSDTSETAAEWDVAVIGAGLAGAIAARRLASRGRRVVLFERESKPHHKVCGEFLSAESHGVLQEAGIDLLALGAVPIRRFRFHSRRFSMERRLPQSALGLSRFVLDEVLMARVRSAGARVETGCQVKGLAVGEASSIVRARDRDWCARRVVLATGKFDLGSIQSRTGDDTRVGLKMHLKLSERATAKLGDSCDLFVFDGGYGGLSRVENGRANFCFLLESGKLKEIGAKWDSLVDYLSRENRALSEYLREASPEFERPLAVARVPYGFIWQSQALSGVFPVGDQLAVIPSLTGDGMSIACRSGRMAADHVDADLNSSLASAASVERYRSATVPHVEKQVSFAWRLHRLLAHPRLCETAAFIGGKLPLPLDSLFHRTRCRIGEELDESSGLV